MNYKRHNFVSSVWALIGSGVLALACPALASVTAASDRAQMIEGHRVFVGSAMSADTLVKAVRAMASAENPAKRFKAGGDRVVICTGDVWLGYLSLELRREGPDVLSMMDVYRYSLLTGELERQSYDKDGEFLWVKEPCKHTGAEGDRF
ncbi:MAG: hypothetical protein JSS11_05345 [Verrucomicrobia bacterium]|nr:hypothetical protein [Verrucomicrobiota bacterium]